MHPLVQIPATIAAGMKKRREVFRQDEGFNHRSTGLKRRMIMSIVAQM
jgi:hypothetical protein